MAFSRRGERDRCHATPQRIYPLDRTRAAPALGADASPIARIAGLAAATGRARGRTGPLRRSRHTTRPLKPQDLSRTSAKEPCTCRRAGALPIGCQPCPAILACVPLAQRRGQGQLDPNSACCRRGQRSVLFANATHLRVWGRMPTLDRTLVAALTMLGVGCVLGWFANLAVHGATFDRAADLLAGMMGGVVLGGLVNYCLPGNREASALRWAAAAAVGAALAILWTRYLTLSFWATS